MQNDILNKIHFNLIVVQKCRGRPRRAVYWPNINEGIELKVKVCDLWEIYQCSKSK